jgi:hypothetical protein
MNVAGSRPVSVSWGYGDAWASPCPFFEQTMVSKWGSRVYMSADVLIRSVAGAEYVSSAPAAMITGLRRRRREFKHHGELPDPHSKPPLPVTFREFDVNDWGNELLPTFRWDRPRAIILSGTML